MTPSSADARPDTPANRVHLIAVERRLSLIERRVAFFEGRLQAVEQARAGREATADVIGDLDARLTAVEGAAGGVRS